MVVGVNCLLYTGGPVSPETAAGAQGLGSQHMAEPCGCVVSGACRFFRKAFLHVPEVLCMRLLVLIVLNGSCV